MHSGTKALIPILFLASVVLSSGCVNLDPQALALANPMIKEFLDDHPNAEIKITHFSALQSENILEQIRQECDNPYIGPKEYYRVNITDPDTDFIAVVWIDWESKMVECAWKLGTEGKETDKPKEDVGCEHHYKYMCKAGNIYWFDSCGNKEDKKETCTNGCNDGALGCWGGEGCKSHAEYKCYGDHVYWFDSCGKRQEKKEYCTEGCELGFCKGRKTCEDMGGYCIYPSGAYATASSSATASGSGTATSTSTSTASSDGSTATASSSSSATATGMVHAEPTAISQEEFCGWSTEQECETDEDCSPGGCSNHVCGGASEDITTTCEYKDCYNADKFGTICGCYEGECRWGYKQAEPIAISGQCKEGYLLTDDYWCPDNGVCCLPEHAKCRSQYEYKCYGDHVYWFDSCGNKDAKKEYCEHGCEAGKCIAEAWEECAESDEGYDIYEKGCTESGNSRLCDHCNNDGTLTEKYCEGDEIRAKTVECPEGYVCEDAACVETAPSCVDSDSGKDYYTAGYVEFDNDVFEDYCADNSTLVEYYCLEGEHSLEDYACPAGCSEGACTEATDCAEEGEQFSVVYTDQYPEECCEGLTEWNSGMDTSLAIGTECYETGLLAGSPVGTCIECGNGICEEIENVCNCPEDCEQGEHPDLESVQDFCDEYVGAATGITDMCEEDSLNMTICSLCNWTVQQ